MFFVAVGGVLVVAAGLLTCVVLGVFASTMYLVEQGCDILGLKYSGMMVKTLRRNPVRAYLSYLATFVLVFVITLVWSVLAFINQVQSEKTADIKTIVTEKYQIPSQMPQTYEGELREELETLPEGQKPGKYDYMPWTFVAATLDKENRTMSNTLFMFAMEPDNLLTSGGKQKAWTLSSALDRLLPKGPLVKQDGEKQEVNRPRLYALLGLAVLGLVTLVLLVSVATIALLAGVCEPILIVALGRPMSAVNWYHPGGLGVAVAVGLAVWLSQPRIDTRSADEGKIVSMMDDLDELPESQAEELAKVVEQMKQNPRGILLGKERLRLLNKRVGEKMTATCLNYKDVTFEFDILAQLPEGRYDQSAVMHRDYLLRSLEQYKTTTGKEHPMAGKTLNLYWIRLPDKSAVADASSKVEGSTRFTAPSVKMEQASAAIGSFLEAYKDIVWGARWLFSPAVLACMSLVMANAISISVRERRPEMAVLKVLGFKPDAVFLMVVGEAILVGALSGFLATSITYFAVNALGGIPFPVAFFPVFYIPTDSLWWGPAIGCLTALIGTVGPAWSARSVKVSEVFAKVS